MKWYFRYPIVIAFFIGHEIFERASRLLPLTDSVFPASGGDWASLMAFMFAVMGGVVLGCNEQLTNKGGKDAG